MPDRTSVESADITLNVAILAAFFASVTAALYTAVEVEPSAGVGLFVSSAPLLAVILWLQKDARRTGIARVQDWGLFLYLAWPVVIPWYAFKTRGRSGWRLMLGLFGLIGAASLAFAAVEYGMSR